MQISKPNLHNLQAIAPIKRIAVFVSGGGTNLQSLLDASDDNKLGGAKVTLVVASNADCYAIQRAEAHQVKCTVWIKETRQKPEYVDSLKMALDSAQIDLIVLAGYLAIIPSELVDYYSGRIINIHPSLLPRHGGKGMYGLRPHEAALKAGDKEAGATVHVVTQGVDTGPIMRQQSITIGAIASAKELQKQVMAKIESHLLVDVIKDWNGGAWTFPYSVDKEKEE